MFSGTCLGCRQSGSEISWYCCITKQFIHCCGLSALWYLDSLELSYPSICWGLSGLFPRSQAQIFSGYVFPLLLLNVMGLGQSFCGVLRSCLCVFKSSIILFSISPSRGRARWLSAFLLAAFGLIHVSYLCAWGRIACFGFGLCFWQTECEHSYTTWNFPSK